MFFDREFRMEDNFNAGQNREAKESLALLPTFMEQVLDTVERVLEKVADRNS